jgi:hypothetical protein
MYFVAAVMQFFPVTSRVERERERVSMAHFCDRQVFVLNIIVQYFDGTGFQTLTFQQLLMLAFSLLVFPMIGSVAQTRHDVTMLHAGVQGRTAVAIAVRNPTFYFFKKKK